MNAAIILFLVLLCLSVVTVIRSVRAMRHQNRMKRTALAAKSILNVISVGFVLLQLGAPHAIKAPWHALRTIPIFANPIALAFLFQIKPRNYLLQWSFAAAGIACAITSWYILGNLGLVTYPHFIQYWFPFNEESHFGALTLFYLGFTLFVLLSLFIQRIQRTKPWRFRIYRSTQWQLYYLANGIFRGIVLAFSALILFRQSTALNTSVAISMTISLLIDAYILLQYGSSRATFFQSEYGLQLLTPWNPAIEQITNLLSRTESFTNTRYSVQDAAQSLKWSAHKVSNTLHQSLGLNFKQVLRHYRLEHYEQLSNDHPELNKKERLRLSGFRSYTSFYLSVEQMNTLTEKAYIKSHKKRQVNNDEK